MRARPFLYIGMMVLALVALTACGQQDKTPEAAGEQATEGAPTAEDVETPAGETDVMAQIYALNQQMRLARRHVERSNRQEGSSALNEIANVLTKRAVVSSGATKEDLQFSASEFSGMAERLYSGPPITVKEIEITISGAYWALAVFHHAQAAQRWSAGNAQQTAAHLSAAAALIDGAIGYASARLEASARDLITQTRDLARQVEQEPAPASGAVSRQIQEIGQQIRRLSNQAKRVLS